MLANPTSRRVWPPDGHTRLGSGRSRHIGPRPRTDRLAEALEFTEEARLQAVTPQGDAGLEDRRGLSARDAGKARHALDFQTPDETPGTGSYPLRRGHRLAPLDLGW